jgi:hypothetical protein
VNHGCLTFRKSQWDKFLQSESEIIFIKKYQYVGRRVQCCQKIMFDYLLFLYTGCLLQKAPSRSSQAVALLFIVRF